LVNERPFQRVGSAAAQRGDVDDDPPACRAAHLCGDCRPELARAQLHALNAQIRPHFLFNTLHTIGQLWRSGQRDDAELVLDHLGSIFHKVQRHTSQTEVPLAEELELVRDYLTIEQVRFRDRLRVSITAPDDVEELLVPPLLLQPLVENAVRHGISRASSSGRVDVTAERQGAELVLTVCDDGAGFDLLEAQRGTGTGLSNTRERLRQLYGDAGVLDIMRSNGNTLARIRIPVHAG
jgi:two-component system, LytTR family, sensor kinase